VARLEKRLFVSIKDRAGGGSFFFQMLTPGGSKGSKRFYLVGDAEIHGRGSQGCPSLGIKLKVKGQRGDFFLVKGMRPN